MNTWIRFIIPVRKDFDREHASLLATLQADKLKLDTERALLQERQQQLEQRLQNTGTLETDLVREREAKHALQVETAAVRRELELLKESNIQLRSAHDAMQSLGKFNGERVAVDTQYDVKGAVFTSLFTLLFDALLGTIKKRNMHC